MILPPSHVAAGTATPTFDYGPDTPSPTSKPPGFTPENWSSLIGIITAIVGNIMISFALNMQRYAHLRLEREWQAKEKARKRRNAALKRSQTKQTNERSSGSQTRKYSRNRHAEYTAENGRESSDEEYIPTESDPLLPSNSNDSISQRSSESSNSPDGDTADQQETYKQKSYLKSPYWWAGIILMTTGEAGNFLAYGFAPASIVSPLGVVALISNCIIAPILLKESFRKRDGCGVLIAVAGAVTVVLSASDNNPKLGPDEIWNLITRWEFETYLGVTVAVIIALLWASNEYGDKSILIDLGLVGLFGGYTALSTKGVASMLSYTLWRAITFPVTYLLVAILVGTAVMQIKYVNRALQRFDATQVIPVQFVLFTLSVILGSAILYRDFERTSSEDAGKFVGGCAMTFLGVWLITSGRSRRMNEDEEDREPEPEDAINLVEDRYHDDVEGGVSEEVNVPSTEPSSRPRSSSPPITIDTRVSDHHRTFHVDTADITFTPISGVPQTPPSERATPLVPAALTTNPWEQEVCADSPSIRHPPPLLSRHTTLSTPVLPSEAAVGPIATISDPELVAALPRPQTPNRNHSDHNVMVTPTTGTVQRLRRTVTSERTGARNSIPGPLLASPLSTSLSAMVQDLKRGGSIKSPYTHRDDGTVRRRESVLGIGASEVEGSEIGEPLGRRRTANDEASRSEDPAATGTVSGRGRSLSGTLNELWKGIRGGGFPDVDGAREDPDSQEQR